MTDLWKLIDRMEQLTDHIEEINNYLDVVHNTNMAFNTWIQTATEELLQIKKDINYLKNKKDCI
jgi:hypothetical protein